MGLGLPISPLEVGGPGDCEALLTKKLFWHTTRAPTPQRFRCPCLRPARTVTLQAEKSCGRHPLCMDAVISELLEGCAVAEVPTVGAGAGVVAADLGAQELR